MHRADMDGSGHRGPHNLPRGWTWERFQIRKMDPFRLRCAKQCECQSVCDRTEGCNHIAFNPKNRLGSNCVLYGGNDCEPSTGGGGKGLGRWRAFTKFGCETAKADFDAGVPGYCQGRGSGCAGGGLPALGKCVHKETRPNSEGGGN